VRIVVLAAGYATRLGSLTQHTPKPLLDLGGRPLLSRLCDRLLSAGPASEIAVVANARFAEVFRAWAAASGLPVPIRILDDGTSSDVDRLGAVGDLAFALDTLAAGDEDWLVSAGDMWIDVDLAPVAAAFRATRTPRLLVRRVPELRRPSPYNEVTVDGERVVSFREKPEDPRSDLAAIALYFLPADIGRRVRAYLDAGGNPDAPGHFIAWLVQREPVLASPLEGRWSDIGSPEALRQTRASFAAAGPQD
jgi:glucose-1-phosphate thymidylyltransferase